jgi:hypothetical protein
MLPHRDKWDVHYAKIDEMVYIGRDVFVVVGTSLQEMCSCCSQHIGGLNTRALQRS